MHDIAKLSAAVILLASVAGAAELNTDIKSYNVPRLDTTQTARLPGVANSLNVAQYYASLALCTLSEAKDASQAPAMNASLDMAAMRLKEAFSLQQGQRPDGNIIMLATGVANTLSVFAKTAGKLAAAMPADSAAFSALAAKAEAGKALAYHISSGGH